MIGKKVKVSLRVFDIFKRNMVLIFLCFEKIEALIGLNVASNKIVRISKFDNSLSFGAE